MNIKEFFDGPYKMLAARADHIMCVKMADYGGEKQFSANFRRAAEGMGLTTLQVWGVFADKHWGAVTRFVRHGAVESESITDRIADLINYLHLLYGIIVEDGLAEAETEGRAAPAPHDAVQCVCCKKLCPSAQIAEDGYCYDCVAF